MCICTSAWYNGCFRPTRQKPIVRIGKPDTENVRITSRSTGNPQLTHTVLRLDARLTLGYTSAILILQRWDLAQIPVTAPLTSHDEADYMASGTSAIMQSIASRAMAVLSNLRILTDAYGTNPMYENLLGTYAGVTLVQFADVLTDIRGVADLMQQVDQQRENRLRSREPVLTWATNMMHKKALDLEGADSDHLRAGTEIDWSQLQDHVTFQWVPLGLLDGITND